MDVGEEEVVEDAPARAGEPLRERLLDGAGRPADQRRGSGPRVTVPERKKATGAFLSIASVASSPAGISAKSRTARAGARFIIR